MLVMVLLELDTYRSVPLTIEDVRDRLRYELDPDCEISYDDSNRDIIGKVLECMEIKKK